MRWIRHKISLDARNDIQLNKKRSDSPATLISIVGDNLFHLSAGRDVTMTNENPTNILILRMEERRRCRPVVTYCLTRLT